MVEIWMMLQSFFFFEIATMKVASLTLMTMMPNLIVNAMGF